MVNSKMAIRGGSLAAAVMAVLMFLVVAASAATIVSPLPASTPAGTDVCPADTAGLNLLEPAAAATGSEPRAQVATADAVERTVGEWTPTGGGAGGGGSPKN